MGKVLPKDVILNQSSKCKRQKGEQKRVLGRKNCMEEDSEMKEY